MNPFATFYFAFRLGWRQLSFGKGKFLAAILGVTFSCILIFMQLGFRDSLYESMAFTPNFLNGDLFIEHKQTEALWRPSPFRRAELARAYASPDIELVAPFYLYFGTWRNPENFTKRTIFTFGIAPDLQLTHSREVDSYTQALLARDTVIFDRSSRPEFGPIEQLLKTGPVEIELNNYKINVVGTFRMGISFSSDGNLITSEQNFMRIFPNRNPDQVDLGIVRLKTGADIQKVKHQLRALLTQDLDVFDLKELIAHETRYWAEMVPIGFIFGFGMVMGLIVGMVIIYQILFTDIANHLREYATMKAMGYSHRYLLVVVFSCALILAVIGFVPGLMISKVLYDYTEAKIFLVMPMPLSKILTVFSYILFMCTASGVIAVRKLREASPADMF